jgi:putative Mn2+ efflux pump MntP
MDLLTVLLIAVGLAMDAFAVSIAKGMTVEDGKLKQAILIAALFGSFQMLMPAIGWLVGRSFAETIAAVDHWIAFGLLVFIGAKMIYDALRGNDDEGGCLTLSGALVLAVATSIDALMVGLSFAFLETSVLEPILLIGAVTFALCLPGFLFGSHLGKLFGEKVRIVGGAILILIGLRILVEHLLG